MKKIMFLLFAVLFAGIVFACEAPQGYTERQRVSCVCGEGCYNTGKHMVYHSTTMCDAYCICFIGEIYYVTKSDNENLGKYMFWVGRKKWYFNM